jgi:hypothetical protein
MMLTALLIATFTSPERIPTSPQASLWMLPLMAAIVVVYKATKLPEITPRKFLKETASLFLSILVFIVITAVILHAIAYLISV